MSRSRPLFILAILAVALLAEPESSVGQTPPGGAGVSFGRNIQLSGSDPNAQRQAETALAVNPADPSNMVAVFQGRYETTGPQRCFFAYTFNGGATWTLGGPAPVQESADQCFDPAIAADSQGNFYYSYLDVDFAAPPFGEFDLVVAKSVDGGRTFPTFSVVVNEIPNDTASPSADKDYLAVDTGATSPFRGSIYVAFTNFISGNVVIGVVISRDGGATWSAPETVAPHSENEGSGLNRFGALPVIAPDGTVYVFYSEFPDQRLDRLSIRFAKSLDGGQTWRSPSDVAINLPSPGFFLLKNADPEFGITPFHGLGGGNSMPTAAVAPDGTLYAAWVDFPEGSCAFTSPSSAACTNADVRLSASRDGGIRWSDPVKVSDDTGASDQFLPWMATHPDGRVSLIWLDRRLDPENVNYDAFYTNTLDGTAFLSNVRVSSTTSVLGTVTFVGDYNGLAVWQDGVFPVWGDTRFGSSDIFFAAGKLR